MTAGSTSIDDKARTFSSSAGCAATAPDSVRSASFTDCDLSQTTSNLPVPPGPVTTPPDHSYDRGQRAMPDPKAGDPIVGRLNGNGVRGYIRRPAAWCTLRALPPNADVVISPSSLGTQPWASGIVVSR